MQLVQLTNKLKPLTISAGILFANSAFVYSDVDSHTGILSISTSNKTSEYLKTVDKNEYSLYDINRTRFQFFYANWRKKTLFLSSTKSIIENDDFKAIIAMGQNVVPFIIEEIEKMPSTLVWALNMIYDRKITNNPSTTISEACNLWVREMKK